MSSAPLHVSSCAIHIPSTDLLTFSIHASGHGRANPPIRKVLVYEDPGAIAGVALAADPGDKGGEVSATAAIAREHKRAIGKSDSFPLDVDGASNGKGKPAFTRSNSFIGMQKGARRHAPYGKRADGVWGGKSRGGGKWDGRSSS